MPIAITLAEPGGPQVLKQEDIAVAAPNAGEVRIRQSIVGVNFVDVYFRTGLYPLPASPVVLGLEGAGIVETVGPDVDDLHPGDRVAYATRSAATRRSASCRHRAWSGFQIQSSSTSPVARCCAALPPTCCFTKCIGCAGGDWVLIHAAAGGVGQLVTRWARRLGGRVIATVSSEAKREHAKEAGAEEILLHNSENWPERARRIADGKGVHLAVDGIGGATLARTLGAVRPFGIAARLGQPAGPIPPVRMEELGSPRAIALGRPSVLAYVNDSEVYRSGAADLLAAVEDGLTNPIGTEYPLREAARAHADLEAGRTTGSVVLVA
jgi:NADPH2:quinone reductase